MAVTVGDAVVYYRGDNKDALRSMDETESKSRSWASRLGGIVKTGLIGGTLAVVGLGAAMGKLAFDAMPLEGISKAFQGITGDAEETMRALRKGSLGMVKDGDLMRNYNEAAQLVGKSFADQLPDAMKYLSKVSAATGQDMGYMMDSITKGVGRMSPMILDNLGIQVDLVAANEAYAATLGKSTDELTKTEQQTALMNQVMEKLAENTKNMPDITENASTKWAQLTTKFGNLKDMIGLKVLPVFTAVVTFISDTMIPQIEHWAGVLGNVFGNFIRFIKEGDILYAFEYLGEWLAAAWGAFVAPVLVEFGTSFWEWLTGEYGAINTGVFLIMHRFKPQIIYAFQQTWPGIWDEIKTWPGKFWEWLTGDEGVLAKVTVEMDKFPAAIKEWAREFDFKAIGTAIGEFIVGGAADEMGKDETGIRVVKEFVLSLANAILNIDVVLFQAGQDIAKGLSEKIGEGIKSKWFKTAFEEFLNLFFASLSPFSILGPFLLILQNAGIIGDLTGMASGGIVPGPIGAPMPILAHGGEKVTPYGETSAGANVTLQFNFNNGFSRQEANAAAGLTVDALRLHGVAI